MTWDLPLKMWYSYSYYHNHSGQSTWQTRTSTAWELQRVTLLGFYQQAVLFIIWKFFGVLKIPKTFSCRVCLKTWVLPANQDIWVCWVLNRKLATEDTDAFDILQATGLQPLPCADLSCFKAFAVSGTSSTSSGCFCASQQTATSCILSNSM